MAHFRLSLTFLAVLLAAIGVIIWCLCSTASTAPTRRQPPYGDPILIEAPLYKQRDPAWSDDAMGGTTETIRSAGCTVCSAAMLLSYYGERVTPGELNRFLNRTGGYAPGALLNWDRCADYSGGRVRLQYYGPPKLSLIEKNLAEHNPVIVKIYLHGRIQHWVLIVGTDGPDYLVNDPAGPSDSPVRLSSIANRMYALRIFTASDQNE